MASSLRFPWAPAHAARAEALPELFEQLGLGRSGAGRAARRAVSSASVTPGCWRSTSPAGVTCRSSRAARPSR